MQVTVTSAPRNANWAKALPAWIESLDRRLPQKRRLRRFRDFCRGQGYGEVGQGLEVAKTLDESITAILASPPERVARLRGPLDLRNLRIEHRQAQHDAALARQRQRDERIMGRLDEPGCVLIAGENQVVHRGTLRECRNNLWRVLGLPRDEANGLGRWLIRDAAAEPVQQGLFDRYAAW